MMRQLSVLCFLYLAPSGTDAAQLPSIRITPESGHIRVNKTTVIMCQMPQTITDCKFKIDDRETLDLSEGTATSPIVVKENGKTLYTARYAGAGFFHGHCGVSLSHVAEGFYVIGCQLWDWKGSDRREVSTLMVDNSRPFKMAADLRYLHVEPGSDVGILCSSLGKQKLGRCGLRLPSKRWVHFKKGHQSEETASYQYHGRGLEKGDCGVKLLNVTEADTGLVLCRADVGTATGVHGVVLKVGNLQPTTEILWDEGRNLTRRETLDVECVMRGAYPLPQMVWHYEYKEAQRSGADETPRNKTSFRWPWEDQVLRQHFIRNVGNRLGHRSVQCTAAETFKESSCNNNDSNEKFIEVHPACGMRTTTHYDTAYKSKVAKRDTGYTLYRVSKSGELVEGKDVKFVDGGVGDALPNIWDKDVVHLGDTGEDDDRYETLWDEVTETVHEDGSVSFGPITYAEFTDIGPSCYVGGAYNATPVIHTGTSVIDGYNTDSDTVLYGTDPHVEFVSFPWMAGVYKNMKGGYEQQCGGTLVTETHVVSAAHCFWSDRTLTPYPPDDYMIALGKIFRDWDRVDDMVQKRSVHQLHLHPSWRGYKRNFLFDIAVAELSDSVVYTPRVAPACLDWDDDEKIFEGLSGVVTGWGYTEDGQPSEILRFVELPYVDPDKCIDKLPVDIKSKLSTDKFCAGYTNRNTSVCPGDSGGGILFKDHLYGAHFLKGVVSLSFKPAAFKGKCYVEEVTGFTTVLQSMPWLKLVLGYEGFGEFDFRPGFVAPDYVSSPKADRHHRSINH